MPTEKGNDLPSDPLRDEAYVADVAYVTDEALDLEEIKELLASGFYTPEFVAHFAAVCVADEHGKFAEYAPQAPIVGEKVLKLLGRADGQA